jgi:hypothetical protein
MSENLRIIIPRTKEDLEEIKKLDKKGKLVSVDSYPTVEQLNSIEIENKPKKLGISNIIK